MNEPKILEILGTIGCGILDRRAAQDFLYDQSINIYVRYQKGQNDSAVWRPYIEPWTSPYGLEFNYVWKNWEKAIWAAIVAGCIFRRHRKLNDATKILDIIFEEWKACDLKPDFKITPKKKEETWQERDKKINEWSQSPEGQKAMKDFLGELKFGNKPNPFGSIFGM